MYQGLKYLHLQILCTTALSPLRTLSHNILIIFCARVFSKMTVRLSIKLANIMPCFFLHYLSLSWFLSEQQNRNRRQIADLKWCFSLILIVFYILICDVGSPPCQEKKKKKKKRVQYKSIKYKMKGPKGVFMHYLFIDIYSFFFCSIFFLSFFLFFLFYLFFCCRLSFLSYWFICYLSVMYLRFYLAIEIGIQ